MAPYAGAGTRARQAGRSSPGGGAGPGGVAGRPRQPPSAARRRRSTGLYLSNLSPVAAGLSAFPPPRSRPFMIEG